MSTSGAYYGQAFKPLSRDKINQNMAVAIASSVNAHLNANTLDSSFSTFATVNTSAVIEVQKLALVGSKPFFVALSATVGLLVILLNIITRPDRLECFDLENIVRKLNRN
jgi:hypothetical protein